MESLWSSESDAVGPNFSILTVGVDTNAHLTNNWLFLYWSLQQ